MVRFWPTKGDSNPIPLLMELKSCTAVAVIKCNCKTKFALKWYAMLGQQQPHGPRVSQASRVSGLCLEGLCKYMFFERHTVVISLNNE